MAHLESEKPKLLVDDNITSEKKLNELNKIILPPQLLLNKDMNLYIKMLRKYNVSDADKFFSLNKKIKLEELKYLDKYCIKFLDKYQVIHFRVSGRESKPFFYIGLEENGRIKYKYLSKRTNLNLIIIMTNRKYISQLHNIISGEIESLEMGRPYDILKKYRVYDEMNPRIRQYVIPLFCSPKFGEDCWNETKWNCNTYMQENKEFETNRGEVVRSKSEKMIADLLYSYNNIEYIYEGGLYLEKQDRTIYPDFTVLNKRNGRVCYVEHAGMLDNANYANEFVKKINDYSSEGYVLGRDLYITCETQLYKYNSATIKGIIEEICK